MTVRSITRSRDDITRSLLVLLVCMENIFKELFLSTISRGVPLDCGCKGRYFLQTDQTFQELFFQDFLTDFPNALIFKGSHEKGIFERIGKLAFTCCKTWFLGDFGGFGAMGEILHLCEIISAWWEKC